MYEGDRDSVMVNWEGVLKKVNWEIMKNGHGGSLRHHTGDGP